MNTLAILPSMMHVVLSIHIAGSFIFFGFSLLIFYQIATKKSNFLQMKKSAIVIGAHQLLTGFFLAALSPNMTITSACLQGFVMLGVLVVMLRVLSSRLTHTEHQSLHT